MRGCLTDEVKKISKAALGYDIPQDELRLMPHIQYMMINKQKLDPRRISKNERAILSKWRKLKFIQGGAFGLYVSNKFWDAMSEILWVSYVNI